MQLVCEKAPVFNGREKHFRCYGLFKSHYLTLTQPDLLGSARTGASSLDRLVTIPRMMFSMRLRTSVLEMTEEKIMVLNNNNNKNDIQYYCLYLQNHFSFVNKSIYHILLRYTNNHNLSYEPSSSHLRALAWYYD